MRIRLQGGLLYVPVHGILGLDFLLKVKAVIDIGALELRPAFV